jgi:pimeloyl-ACP methyl ester carboxylesterase
MRHLLFLALLAASLPAVSLPAVAQAAPNAVADFAAGPCTSATDKCVEWVTLDAGGARSMVYRSYPLTVRNAKITRALIMVHGTSRNADHYFTTATGAAFLAGALDDTLVISPAFHSANANCKDSLAPNEVNWSCHGDSWRSGGMAASRPQLSSFDFIDQLLKTLADKKTFPNLKAIVVAGHSAGGQFVSRYQMSNRVHDTLGVPVTYVVANPSSYAWPDATRVLPVDDAEPAAAAAGWKSEKAPHTKFRYGPFDAAQAKNYDAWPFGLEARTTGYTVNETDGQLKAQLASRPTTYLLSQVDTLPLGGFDDSPPAMAQGATRRARGEAFVKYISQTLGAKPNVMIVPECGHNDRCVFTTDAVLPVIFPPVGP